MVWYFDNKSGVIFCPRIDLSADDFSGAYIIAKRIRYLILVIVRRYLEIRNSAWRAAISFKYEVYGYSRDIVSIFFKVFDFDRQEYWLNLSQTFADIRGCFIFCLSDFLQLGTSDKSISSFNTYKFGYIMSKV